MRVASAGLASDAGASEPLPAEIAFLTGYGVPEATLRQAAHLAALEQVSAELALVAYDLLDADGYYRTLARHLDVPFVKHWPALDPAVDPTSAMRSGTARLAAPGPQRLLAAPAGDAVRRLLAARGDRRLLAGLALTTPTHLSRLVRDGRDAAIAHAATHALPDAAPRLSARGKFDRATICVAATAISATAYGGWVDWHIVGDALGLIFFAGMAFRLAVCAFGLRLVPRRPETIDDARAPRFTVLVPLYDEPAIAGELVAALRRLDYPRGKLEILLLLEADDGATREALCREGLPPYMQIVVAPDGGPRTKPRALNVGLQFATGELLTVYDAEDRPDPLQLRRAAAAFASAGPRVACLQARLAVTNARRGLLQVLFAFEYAALFDLYNIGIARARLPLALGGTSNHFRTAVLRRIGGWDAWNVTEDADLGFRLARFGYTTGALDSTTLEDAPDDPGTWFRQRRRWMKGWMQTLVVLARDRTAMRDFGPWRSGVLALVLTNMVTGPLALPYFQVLMASRLVGRPVPRSGHPLALGEAALAASVLSLGLVSTLWCGYCGMRARRLERFVWALPLLPLYQLLVSAATWAACVDLVRRPYHWHKTAHAAARDRRGQARPAQRRPAQDRPAQNRPAQAQPAPARTAA